MTPTTIPGFHLDIDQTLYASDVTGWCDKRCSTWRVDTLNGPPQKSRLLAKTPNYIELTPWFTASAECDARDNAKPQSAAYDWAKGGAP